MRQHLEGIQTESGWFVDTEASATGYADNQRCRESSVNTMERHREQGKPDAGYGYASGSRSHAKVARQK